MMPPRIPDLDNPPVSPNRPSAHASPLPVPTPALPLAHMRSGAREAPADLVSIATSLCPAKPASPPRPLHMTYLPDREELQLCDTAQKPDATPLPRAREFPQSPRDRTATPLHPSAYLLFRTPLPNPRSPSVQSKSLW